MSANSATICARRRTPISRHPRPTRCRGTTTPCTSPSQDCWIPHLPLYSQFPNLTAVTELISEGASSYHSLQATLSHRFTHDLGLNANYTWAHGMNNAPNYAVGATGNGVIPSQISRLDYGDSDLDIRNRFAMLLNYSLPFGKSAKGFKARLIKGWQANAIYIQSTGQPFSITDDTAYSNTGVGGGQERSLLIGNPSAPGFGHLVHEQRRHVHRPEHPHTELLLQHLRLYQPGVRHLCSLAAQYPAWTA